MNKFSAHGDFRLWINNQTLCAELFGVWNKQAAQQFSLHFKQLGTKFSGEWAHIVYLNDWELCTEDVFKVIEELVEWSINNGLVRAANVYTPSTMKSIFINTMVVEEKGMFKRAVFDNKSDAKKWLEAEGYPLNQSEKTSR